MTTPTMSKYSIARIAARRERVERSMKQIDWNASAEARSDQAERDLASSRSVTDPEQGGRG